MIAGAELTRAVASFASAWEAAMRVNRVVLPVLLVAVVLVGAIKISRRGRDSLARQSRLLVLSSAACFLGMRGPEMLAAVAQFRDGMLPAACGGDAWTCSTALVNGLLERSAFIPDVGVDLTSILFACAAFVLVLVAWLLGAAYAVAFLLAAISPVPLIAALFDQTCDLFLVWARAAAKTLLATAMLSGLLSLAATASLEVAGSPLDVMKLLSVTLGAAAVWLALACKARSEDAPKATEEPLTFERSHQLTRSA